MESEKKIQHERGVIFYFALNGDKKIWRPPFEGNFKKDVFSWHKNLKKIEEFLIGWPGYVFVGMDNSCTIVFYNTFPWRCQTSFIEEGSTKFLFTDRIGQTRQWEIDDFFRNVLTIRTKIGSWMEYDLHVARKAIQKSTNDLAATKGSFKSSQIAKIRQDLEAVLKNLSKEEN